MRHLNWIIFLLGLCCTFCRAKESPPAEVPPEAAVVASSNPGDAKADKTGLTAQVTGKLLAQARPDGGPSESQVLVLRSGADHRVEGNFKLDGSEYHLSGHLESDNLRLWVLEVGTDTPRRGVLQGTPEPQGYRGTFSVSGNGGKPSVEGTFNTNGVFNAKLGRVQK